MSFLDWLGFEGSMCLFSFGKLFCDFKYIVADKRKRKSNPVKFSTEDDLSSQECEHILSKCVPTPVRQVKTSMVLFLRYECVCHALQVCVCVCVCARPTLRFAISVHTLLS